MNVVQHTQALFDVANAAANRDTVIAAHAYIGSLIATVDSERAERLIGALAPILNSTQHTRADAIAALCSLLATSAENSAHPAGVAAAYGQIIHDMVTKTIAEQRG